MDNQIKRHRERRQRMNAFFAKPANATIIRTQADVAADVVTFTSDSAAWEVKAVEIETLEGNPNAVVKKTAMKAMVEVVTRWGQRVMVKLRRLGLVIEMSVVNHQPSDFYGIEGAAAIDMAKGIRKVLNDNIAALAGQGVTASVIADIDAKINAAGALLTRPAQAGNDLETKRAALAAGDAALELELEDVVNTLHAEFRYTNADFDRALMVEYELRGDTGKRYTGIEGTAKSRTAALRGYTVRRADDHTKAGVVDTAGAYSIKGMRSGDVLFELVDGAGAVKATKELRLKLGTVVVWDWVVG